MKRLPHEQKQEIIRLYQEGATPKDLAVRFGILNNSVTRILRKEGIERTQLIRVDQVRIDQIIDQYHNKKISSEIIAFNMGLDSTTVCRILKRNNIPIRPAIENKRQYEINEGYFTIIDTERKAYFLGFLYADGNLSSRKSDNKISMVLHEKDQHILEDFSNDIYGFVKLYQDGTNEKGEKYMGCAVYCHKMHQELTNLGCPPRKTFIITFPTFDIVPKHLSWHFIRGFMDGDGCISVNQEKKSTCIDFTANKEFIEGLISFVEAELSIECNKMAQRHEDTNTRSIQFRATEDLKQMLEAIYHDATIYLTRKKDKYLEFLAIQTTKKIRKQVKHMDITKYGTTFIPEFNGQLLIATNVAQLTEEEKQKATEYLLAFYRAYGFPYPTLTQDELLTQFMHLINTIPQSILKDNNVLAINNQNGIPIFKHFSPHFFEVESGRSNRKLNMLQSFQDDELLRQVIKNRLDQNFNMTGNMLKQGLTNSRIAYQASIFNPAVAKYLYAIYTQDSDIIYDYSMGFGQRLLAALSLPHKITYIGVDPMAKTVESNQHLFDFFRANKPGLNKEAELICLGAENYCDDKYKGKVKLAFSSPPYWNVESYSDELTQAGQLSYTDFLKWWRKVTQNIDGLLKSDGYFILNMAPQVKPFEIKEDMCNIIKESGFEMVKEYQMQLTRNTTFANKRGEHKYEPISVFRRK